MHWRTVTELIEDLNLKESANDLPALRREIISRMSTIHPDKNGSEGTFRDAKDKEEFSKLTQARDFIDAKTEEAVALVPIDRLLAIFETFGKAQLAPVDSRIDNLRTEARSVAISDLHSRLVFPRITSGVFAAIAGSTATFGRNFQDDPILGNIVASPLFGLTMTIIAFYAVMSFIMTWFVERQEETLIDRAMSEYGRREIAERLVGHSARSEHPTITLSDVIREVNDYCRGRIIFPPFLRTSIGLVAAEKIARSLILELEERDVIERTNKAGFDIVYKISNSMLDELKAGGRTM